MGTPIAEQLQDAIRHKNLSIKDAAAAAGIQRTFLNRLLKGGDPPRTLKGRHTAEHDERYRLLAETLEMNVDAFIADVRQVQLGEADSENRDGLADRYPEFRGLLNARLPIKTEKAALRLLHKALEDLSPKRAKKLYTKILSSLEEMALAAVLPSRPRSPDYMGSNCPVLPLNPLGGGTRKTCNRIGRALVRLSDQETSGDRIKLAALFYELASSAGESSK